VSASRDVRLDQSVLDALHAVSWFSQGGRVPVPVMPFPVRWVPSTDDVLRSIRSNRWTIARAEAKNGLTAFLTKADYDAYGVSWNAMARTARTLIERSLTGRMRQSALAVGLSESVLPPVILDAVMIVLERSYSAFHPPVFFGHLLSLYQAGRLPCGWDGDLESFPQGNLVAW
jgi:hypothetical protein